jgi:hypothetical protein
MKNWSKVPDGRLTPRQTGRLTVGRKLTSTSTSTTWHPGLLYKLSKLLFSNNLIKLISSFLTQRKFRVSVEGEVSTLRYMQAGVPQGSVLSPTLYNLYINDTPQAPGVNCGRHLSICDRPKRGLRRQKDPAWPKLYGRLVFTMEY